MYLVNIFNVTKLSITDLFQNEPALESSSLI